MISLQNVTKSFEDFRLGPLNFEVEPGYVVAVVGPNGSGKSTLFRMLMDLVHPDEGELRVFDQQYPKDTVSIKRRIGYVPENSVGHDELDAREFGSFVAHWYPPWNGRLYDDLLERFEINHWQRFDRLSKGMKRRLVFAAAVAAEPGLLLLDEPTDGVDPFARRIMLEEVSTYLRDESRSVFFATHSNRRGPPHRRLHIVFTQRFIPRALRERYLIGELERVVGRPEAGDGRRAGTG